MRRSALVVVCSFLACAPTAVFAGGIPAKTLKELKAASVYIKVPFLAQNGKPMPATGSGFLVHVENGVGYVATNNHVVSPRAGDISKGPPKVVFHSGTPDELTVEAQVVAREPLRDLAILKITGVKDLPKPIPLDHTVEAARKRCPCSPSGFPLGETWRWASPTRPSPSPRG